MDYEPTNSKPSNASSGSLNAYTPLLFALVLMVGMQLGFKLYETLKGKPQQVVFANQSTIPEIEEVFNYIDAKYVDTVSTGNLVEKAIVETLSELDPHSNYIPAKELQDVTESLQGNFEGIGVEFSIVKDTIVVVTPIAGGPSEKLGIRAGDKIVAIEDTLVAGIGITNKEVVSKLRGEKGTTVNVGIYRKGVPEVIDYAIKRDQIPLVSVDVHYMLDEEVGYIKINRFSATTYNEFARALYDLKETHGMSKLILDLRQNPGGYLTAAVNIADEFVDGKKLLVYTEGRNTRRKDYTARRRGAFEDGELVVLIDEGSASASEIVSGAVQDWDRGTVVGRRSFGKGLVQEQYDLSNGSALRLTVARYHTPSGRCIQKPYDDGVETYRKEISARYDQKPLTADSLQQAAADTSKRYSENDTVVYKTLIEGRVVHGGGGVSPDIVVPIDTTGGEVFLIKAKSLIAQFVYDYYSNNNTEFEQYKSRVNDASKLTAAEISERNKKLQDYLANFEVGDALFGQYTKHVKGEIKKFKGDLLLRDKAELKTIIKAYLARQMWANEGFYQVYRELDDGLQTAYGTIKKTDNQANK